MERQINRRTVIKTAVMMAIAVFGNFPINSVIAQVPKRIRYGAHTPEGASMLRIYANAVKAMEDPSKYKEGDPRSWLFQWYTHAVRFDSSKAEEIIRVYNGSTGSSIAQKMWDTCEAHRDSSRENFFLPWHRMYLLYFEEIVRHVSGQNEFTLPYWDYSNAAHSALPAEFRKPGDLVWGVLYRPHRNKHVNDGRPIDEPDGAFGINLDAMKSNNYEDKNGDAGFCSNLDSGLHGGIHLNVGNGEGMGSVEWAARDPIFWLHHSNIDRIWASWARKGGKHPADVSFLTEEFDFADGDGNGIKAKVENFMELTQYEYEEYLTRPSDSVPFNQGPRLVAEGWRFDSSEKIKLSDKNTVVKLAPPKQGPGGGPLPTSAADVKSLPSEALLFLRLEGLRAFGPTKTVFDVHVGPIAQKPERKARSFVGSVNFFGATMGHHQTSGALDQGRVVSFVLSQQSRQLLSDLSGAVQITFVPRGDASQEHPEVSRVSLVVG
jgi:hypothetical protein